MSLVNAAFKSSKKIEMLIFAATHKTRGLHREVLTTKDIKIYSAFARGCTPQKKFLGDPA